jgi:hypothetical protein
MSKAFIQLNDNLAAPMELSINTADRTKPISNIDWNLILRYILYGLILLAAVGILVRWWRSEAEPFDPDHPGSRDSFPARINSNTTMNRAGRCNTPYRAGRSILKPFKKGVGYVRPFDQTEEEKERERRKLRVRWSDPLVKVMGHE